jgi:site-specific recombinase XerD
MAMSASLTFPILLERFFTERLMRHKHVSPHTIASYRDTFCLLLRYAQSSLHKGPSQLILPDLDATLIAAFLDDLQTSRGTSARSRNVRLAAIHSFFRYAALEAPEHSGLIERVLAIPAKRYERAPIAYLTPVESEALLAAPDLSTWLGRRDRTLLLVALQTGLRVSELIGLRWQDVTLETGAHVRCQGKGRKERCTPLRKEAVTALRAWQREQVQGSLAIVFPSTRGGTLSRDAVADLLKKHLVQARQQCPSLVDKDITPHGLRHSAAMALLHSGVDCAVIAMWLGHESMDTTQIYLHASLELKQQALDRTTPLSEAHARYRPDDALLAFLKGL